MPTDINNDSLFIPHFVKRLCENLIHSKYVDPNWHRYAVGGLWEEIGRLQFDFMVDKGLRPHHYLLDIGCGSLRGGVHFIRYLEKGHYYGIDKSKDLLYAGIDIELKRYNLTSKAPILVRMDDFNLPSLNQEFDYVLAQSLFTHLRLDSVKRCIEGVDKVLVKGGKFHATFAELPAQKRGQGKSRYPAKYLKDIATNFGRGVFYYDFYTFQSICERTSLKVEYIGDWGHPRHQKMITFTKT